MYFYVYLYVKSRLEVEKAIKDGYIVKGDLSMYIGQTDMNSPINRESVRILLDSFLADRDESIFLPAIGAMLTPDDADTFAIMQGSGNEMSPFDQFLHLSEQRGFLKTEEGNDFIHRFYATQSQRKIA